MTKQELRNYYQLAFINGVNDAISVILLYKVFVVLMTGNIRYSIADIITNPQFSDFVRITLLFNFIISGVIVHGFIAKRTIKFRIAISSLFVLIYCFSGTFVLHINALHDNSFGFLILANIATIMSVIMNNIFYRFHSTKINLVAYTMNLINLSHMIAEKRYHDITILSTTILSFIIGLIVGAYLTSMIYFFAILIVVPVLINLYITNHKINIQR
ncbi:DUF1275 domain-containing protein [Francisella tularensis]|uniref:NADH dehydrogenase subunit n=6 Tax=Francisella tularensis TaxID=263 RepID=A0AAI8BI98_FRATH|nr:YoaK family protein [Francisella tularensis]AFX71244.1 hypothetical protein F92_08985 [Francisella tularensis subsp. holarctica F92]EBA53076.1 NADH dehydrogenase subunit [Francisella tularensis subsp. holarctica 257]ABI83364.1 conserved hypothetical protein [Francisella tularensis subsp. holarctica OSU18]ABU62189.1 hypothetical membrane protein [Francisella tularensis subsp. holarctica FTNF002-00]AFT93246.1 hypothetical protein FTS_1585 [Francisella tularensis subsp. holarctica FSC200]